MSNALLRHIASEVIGRPQLILPDKLAIIADVLGERIGIDAAALDLGPMPEASRFVGSRRDANGRGLPYSVTEDGTAIITITGTLVNRGAWVGANSGLTSYEGIQFQLASAVADPNVRAIALDLQSPGGQAIGAFETADAVRVAAKQKPVTAVVNGMAASAAYAIASAASRIVTTPSGISGSIGVVLMHADYSRKLDREGVTPTLIFAGAHKVDGNPYQPLSDDVRVGLQAEVNKVYDQFIQTVAAGRKCLSSRAVRALEAGTFIGADAVQAGLADDVGTFEAALSTISRGAGRRTTRMTKMEFTQADLDRARSEGHAAGKAEGLELGKAEGHKAGAADERARVMTILGSEEAKGHPGMALRCVKTGMSIDGAKEMLLGAREDAEATAAAAAEEQPASKYKSLDQRGTEGTVHFGAVVNLKPASGALSPEELAAGVNKAVGRAR